MRNGLDYEIQMSNEKRIQRSDGLALQETKPKLKKPKLYRVILVNDDFTPMEFVVVVLEQIFQMPSDKAERIMLNVHQKGMGVCGVYICEIAEMKVRHVLEFAHEHQHPLQCTMEPE